MNAISVSDSFPLRTSLEHVRAYEGYWGVQGSHSALRIQLLFLLFLQYTLMLFNPTYSPLTSLTVTNIHFYFISTSVVVFDPIEMWIYCKLQVGHDPWSFLMRSLVLLGRFQLRPESQMNKTVRLDPVNVPALAHGSPGQSARQWKYFFPHTTFPFLFFLTLKQIISD